MAAATAKHQTMATSSQQLLMEELREHNDYFDMLVDMIPSTLYIAGNSGDDYNPKHNKYHRQNRQADTKEARRAAAKQAKRRRLNPQQSESTVQIKARLEQQQSGGSSNAAPTLPGTQSGKQTKEAPATAAKTSNDIPTASPSASPKQQPYQSRIEALRAKLQAKIAAKSSPTRTPDQISKRAARRAEKQRRRQEAAQRNKKTSSSQVGNDRKNAPSVTAASDNNNQKNDDPTADLMAVGFGRLTGLSSTSSQNYQQTNKALANLQKGKPLERLLADAERKREKLQQLTAPGASAEEQERAQAMQWTDTFHEANGRRVKDNPAQLKKALKKKATKKKKSTKAWKSRLKQTAAQQQERQAIRQHNLQARQQGVGGQLSKKRIVSNDKDGGGRRRLSRAGFEGRKQDFLNGSSSGGTSSKGGKSAPRE